MVRRSKSYAWVLIVFFALIIFGTLDLSAQINSEDRHWSVFYGWPSLVKDTARGMSASGNVNAAADIFDEYRLVVFNGMVEQETEPNFNGTEAAKTTAIISELHNRNTKVYGYIAIGGANTSDPPAESTNWLKSMIDDWIDEFNVDGFFFDEAGFDYHNNDAEMRARQVAVANHVHERLTNQSGSTLHLIMNAWMWDDIYTLLPGNPVPMLAGDGFCVENWILESSTSSESYRPYLVENNRADDLLVIKNNFEAVGKPQKMYCLTVGKANSFAIRPEVEEVGWYMTLAYGFDYHSYQGYDFSAADNELVYHTHDPINVGNSYSGSSVIHLLSGRSNYRQTDTGRIWYYNNGSDLRAGFIGSVDPVIYLTTPDSQNNSGDANFRIQWIASDPKTNAVISLFYASVPSANSGTLIVTGLLEDNDTEYLWDTSGLPNTNIYIFAEILGNNGVKVTNAPNQMITIYHSPDLTIDGDLTDWPSTAWTNSDPAGDTGCTDAGVDALDIRMNRMIDIGEKLYFSFTVDAANVFSDTGNWKEVYVFLDTDNNPTTGFQYWPFATGSGFEYRIHLGYTDAVWDQGIASFVNNSGTGDDWSLDWVDTGNDPVFAGLGSDLEMSVKISEVGSPDGVVHVAFVSTGAQCAWVALDLNPGGLDEPTNTYPYNFQGTGDQTPPVIKLAENTSFTTIRIIYDELVGPSATNTWHYLIGNGVGAPVSAVVSGTYVDLHVSTPLTGGNNYMISVYSNEDNVGNMKTNDIIGFTCDTFTIPVDGDLSDWPAFTYKNNDPVNDVQNTTPIIVSRPNIDILTNYFVGSYAKLYFGYLFNDDITNLNSGSLLGTGFLPMAIYIDRDNNTNTGSPSGVGPWWVEPRIGADYKINLQIGADPTYIDWNQSTIQVWNPLAVDWTNTGERPLVYITNNIIELMIYKSQIGGISGDTLGITYEAQAETTSPSPNDYLWDVNNDPTEPAMFVTSQPPAGGPAVLSTETYYSTTLKLYFNRLMDVATAENSANYSLDGGIGAPVSVVLDNNDFSVLLTFSTPMLENTGYVLTINSAVLDAWMNPYTDGFVNFTTLFMKHSDIVLNEIMISPNGLDFRYEWFEIYNKGIFPIHMTNWVYNINGASIDLPVIDINVGDMVVFAIDSALTRYGSIWGDDLVAWGDDPCEAYGLYDYANTQMGDSQTYYLSDQTSYTDAVHINTSTANFSYEKIDYTIADSSSPGSPTILDSDPNWGLCTNDTTLDIYPWNDGGDAGTPGFFNSIMNIPVPTVSAPVISSLSASEDTDGSGNVLVNYTGTDANDDSCTYVLAEYSTNNSIWLSMTPDSGDARHSSSPLAFSASGTGLSFVWDSVADLGAIYDGTVWIRLQVNDGVSNSSVVSTASFVLDNALPGVSSLLTPPDASWTASTTPLFTWSPAIDDSSIIAYRIQIDNNI